LLTIICPNGIEPDISPFCLLSLDQPDITTLY
jgi:hypothetical protein